MSDEQWLADIKRRMEECRNAGGKAGFEGWFSFEDIEFLVELAMVNQPLLSDAYHFEEMPDD